MDKITLSHLHLRNTRFKEHLDKINHINIAMESYDNDSSSLGLSVVFKDAVSENDKKIINKLLLEIGRDLYGAFKGLGTIKIIKDNDHAEHFLP